MTKTIEQKVKWTMSFDCKLKSLVVQEAKQRGVDPATVLETLFREKFSRFGYGNIEDSASYITAIRKQRPTQSDADFLAEIKAWQKPRSS